MRPWAPPPTASTLPSIPTGCGPQVLAGKPQEDEDQSIGVTDALDSPGAAVADQTPARPPAPPPPRKACSSHRTRHPRRRTQESPQGQRELWPLDKGTRVLGGGTAQPAWKMTRAGPAWVTELGEGVVRSVGTERPGGPWRPFLPRVGSEPAPSGTEVGGTKLLRGPRILIETRGR